MVNNATVARLMQLSSEMVEESRRLKEHARATIFRSEEMLSSSKRLLLSLEISGTPALPVQETTEDVASDAGTLATVPAGPSSAEHTFSPERVVGQDFTDTAVRLDGRHFVDCNLRDCVLEYSGGPVILEGTHFSGCRFQFSGEAAMTVAMLECFGLLGPGEGGRSTSDGSKPRVN